MTLNQALSNGQARNLDLLRLWLAVAVIISHAWPLTLGAGTPEPLENMTGRSLGGWSVGIFFFLSGLLITASAERKDVMRFWTARARRLLPGLVMALLVTLALATLCGAKADSGEAAFWFIRAITLISIEHRLTDAFSANPYPAVVNGPLWSLFYEVAAYGACAALVWTGVTRSKALVFALLSLATLVGFLHDALPGRLSTFAPLFSAFTWGMAAHVWRDRLPLSPMLGFVSLGLGFLMPWTLAAGLIGFALVVLFLRAPAVPLNSDVSYGLYIYGWPCAQTIVSFWPDIDPVLLSLFSIVVTYPVAITSWHFIERPALRGRHMEA